MQPPRRGSRCYSCSRWAWRLALCLAVFLCVPWTWAETESSSRSVTVSWSTLSQWAENLQRADALLTTLTANLETRSDEVRTLQLSLLEAGRHLAELNSELENSRVNLSAAETSRVALELALAEMQQSLATLMATYDRLSKAFAEYKQIAEAALDRVTRSRGVWRAIGIGTTIVAVVCGILAAVQ